MNVKNPLDIGPSGIYSKLLPMLLADPEIDMVLAIMVIPYEAVRNFKSAGFRVRDWFGDISSVREQYPEKPLVSVAIGHPEYLEDIASLCGRSIPIFASPEAAARPLLRSGVIPRHERNQETKDLILVKLKLRKAPPVTEGTLSTRLNYF